MAYAAEACLFKPIANRGAPHHSVPSMSDAVAITKTRIVEVALAEPG